MDTPPPTPPYLKMSKDLQDNANEEKITLRNPSQRLIPLTDELKKAMENFNAWLNSNSDDEKDKSDDKDEQNQDKSKEKNKENEDEKEEDTTNINATGANAIEEEIIKTD